ncbi:mechanosensitive ion channel family protein [Cerasicoccus maritimus]|uniref:mechanosensitive ion channel family protein n=1 Tax=Cerasicoccus maritimus TaxID=490089 RepID=UPI002852CECB|nr:mechanosensitive ion channel domain-containing protein [Cerasicoccus maritimus]
MSTLEWFYPAQEATNTDHWWQVIVVSVIWLGLYLAFRPELKETPERYNPKVWFGENKELIALALACLLISITLVSAGIPAPIFRMAATIFTLWSLIGFATSFIRDRFWAQSTATILFLISAFEVLIIDDVVIDFLKGKNLPFTAGNMTLTFWDLITVAISLAIALWVGIGLSQLIERRVDTIDRINPSTRALIGKFIRIIFIVLAMVIGLTSVGIDLSALTIFGGALGIGLGFGLQKIVSNLISGFILLSDRSIKPGDVIELEGTYGWINSLRARYVSVITRDGTEHLIPNEDLITQRVVNWSFSHDRVRIRLDVGISYNEDPHRAIEICKAAAAKQTRVLKDPPPVCLLKGFGDSSVDLQLRFWIRDPNEGVANVQSLVLLEIWDRFKEEGIEIPFPQRDLHLKSTTPIIVQATPKAPDAEDETV